MSQERELAKVRSADIIIEDHGIPVLDVTFDYDGGSTQGLGGYTLDAAFVMRFMCAIGSDSLSGCVGKSCWVTHDHCSISKVEPLHKKDGTPFVIKDWQEWFKRRMTGVSASEMRTGIDPKAERVR